MQNSNIKIFSFYISFMCLWHMYQIQISYISNSKVSQNIFSFWLEYCVIFLLLFKIRKNILFLILFLMSFSRRRPENKIYWIVHSIPFPVPVVIIDFNRIFKNIFIIISTNKNVKEKTVLLMEKHFLFL